MTTIKQIDIQVGRYTPALYLVQRNGVTIGQLEKSRNTPSEVHPWKAFEGTGDSRRYLRAFYEADGGKISAIKEIERVATGARPAN